MRQLDDGLSATVLPISDTQFGRYHRFDEDDSLAGHLVRDVVRLVPAEIPPIDLVVLSGDIAERGKRPEYEQARNFIDQICRALDLGPERVVVVPGNHDVSWDLCQATFAEWRDEHEDTDPPPPYPRKWRHYQDFVTGLHGPAAFTEEQPYRLHRFEDLRVVVAAMNSTIRESHKIRGHGGMAAGRRTKPVSGPAHPAPDGDPLGPAMGRPYAVDRRPARQPER
jgi:hypothetical protein